MTRQSFNRNPPWRVDYKIVRRSGLFLRNPDEQSKSGILIKIKNSIISLK